MKALTVVFIFGTVLGGCSISIGGMGATEFYTRFPVATETSYYSGAEAIAAIASGECLLLSSNKFYAAPLGWTAAGDLENGAKGVDGIVKNDGGNAYRIQSYEWTDGGVQLQLVFDTMLCNPDSATDDSQEANEANII